MCPKCSNQGRYYKHEAGVTHIIPCSCKESMTIRQAKERQYKKFCERFELHMKKLSELNPAKSAADRRNFLTSYLWYYGHSKEDLVKMSLAELEHSYINSRIDRTPTTNKKVYGFIIPVS